MKENQIVGQAKKEMIRATRKPTPPEARFFSVKTHSYCFPAFTVFDSRSGQGPDHFAMGGLGEEIHWDKAFGAVAFLGQESEVAGHGLGVAADIDHPLRGHPGHALKEPGGRALSGRVHEDDVCPLRRLPGSTRWHPRRRSVRFSRHCVWRCQWRPARRPG